MSGASAHLYEPTGLNIEALYTIGSGTSDVWSFESPRSIEIDFGGIPGDRHHGATREIRRYESAELVGLEVANDRQLTIVDADDIQDIAAGLELPTDAIENAAGMSIERFLAGQMAANVLVRQLDGSKRLNDWANPGAVFVFGDVKAHQVPSARITEYNTPCSKPMRTLSASLQRLGISPRFTVPELSTRFKELAHARRGWAANVYSAGRLAVGQDVARVSPILLPGTK